MAYISQEKKALLAPGIKAVLKKFGMKGTIATSRHRSTLICNISQGPLDIIGNGREVAMTRSDFRDRGPSSYLSVNPYWLQEHYTGKVREFLMQLRDIMNDGNFDKSDIQTDYFCVGWYIDINIGKWNKPYQLTA